MAYEYSGMCSCGSVQIAVMLPQELENYTPRACDCDFCTSRNIEYLSHPGGKLYIDSVSPLRVERQGSDQAGFLTCSKCGNVIAATLEPGGRMIGALNATLLSERSRLLDSQVVSPRLLGAKDKVQRWEEVWMEVRLSDNVVIQ